MRNLQLVSFRTLLGMTLAWAAFGSGVAAQAQTETTLYDFTGNPSGRPVNALAFDRSGNLFGTTEADTYNLGTVFELSPAAGGGWNETTLYTFQNEVDGESPSTNLVADAAGNLYGATAAGGSGNLPLCWQACGIVFELSPDSSGGWTKTTILNFGLVPTDGTYPGGNLVMDAAGNLYGVTEYGGAFGWGTVFELSPQFGGGWKETILYNFGKTAAGGELPKGGVVFDKQGNLYGTTTWGGHNSTTCSSGCGTVFELSPSAGKWTKKLLHVFQGPDGGFPTAAIAFDSAGNIYSTTQGGGTYSAGVVFELTPKSGGAWQMRLLHTFNGTGGGLRPNAGVVLDAKGNLYGTTQEGGKIESACKGASGCGLVYKLSPTAGGDFRFRVLYDFTGGSDGYYLANPLVLTAWESLFGAAVLGGGSTDAGSLFEITP
jgi:uncharacterized repeat protein (TIGR03803 family)